MHGVSIWICVCILSLWQGNAWEQTQCHDDTETEELTTPMNSCDRFTWSQSLCQGEHTGAHKYSVDGNESSRQGTDIGKPTEHEHRPEEDAKACQIEGEDNAAWCTGIPPNNCYTDYYVCCETCPRFITGIAGCRYGDRFSWCESMDASLCYRVHIRQGCCVTCPRHARNRKGCEYGDHFPWCSTMSPERCAEAAIQAECCATCIGSALSLLMPRSHPTAMITTRFHVDEDLPLDCTGGDLASWCPELKFRAICYSDPDLCCSTCLIRWTAVPDCEFGDRVSWCKEIDMTRCPHDAYYQQQCCQSCAPFIVSTHLTEVGSFFVEESTLERETGCSTKDPHWCLSLPGYACYKSSDICCEKCQQFQTDISDCPFGDKNSACGDIKSVECYYPHYDELCCDTCERLKRDIPDCLYGDRFDECSNANCADAIVRHVCCETCSDWSQVDADHYQPSIDYLLPQAIPLNECVDKESWCATIPPEDCVYELETCCHTCASLNK